MTLTELYTARVATLEQIVDVLKADITSAQNSKKQTLQDQQFWVDRIASRDTELQQAESAIATTSTVAEIEAIAVSMRELKIDRRASQAKLNLALKSLSVSTSTLDSLVEKLSVLTAKLSTTRHELDKVTYLDEKHQAWIGRVSVDPLASIPSQADSILTMAIEPALEKLKTNTSEPFINMLSERLTHHWDELDDLETRIDELMSLKDANIAVQLGREGEMDTKLRVYDSAVSDLNEFVVNSQAILDSAQAAADRINTSELLNSVQKSYFDGLMAQADIDVDVLAPESILRITEHELLLRIRELETARTIAHAANPGIDEVDLDEVSEVKAILNGTDGKDAIGIMQTAYDDAVSAVGVTAFDGLIEKETVLATAKQSLQSETHAFLEENPELDPEIATELDTARDAVSDAQDQLNVVHSDMTGAAWYKLEKIEVAIPTNTWVDALYLLNARRQLNRLKLITPNDLAAAVTSAANELAAAVEVKINGDDGTALVQQLINQYQEKFRNTTAKGTESALSVALGVL